MDALSRCRHIRMRSHTFSDGSKLKLCPDCGYKRGRKVLEKSQASAVGAYARHCLGETATERCFREILIGVIQQNPSLTSRGIAGLLTTARKACKKIVIPDQPAWEYKGRVINDGGNPFTDAIAVDLIVGFLHSTNDLDPRHFGRRCFQIKVDALRKSTSKKALAARSPVVAYNDAMGNGSHSEAASNRVQELVCQECGKAWYATHKDAKFCSPGCQKRARRKVVRERIRIS
jgi:hypothetical protein